MLGKDFPVTKSDVHYNSETREVTLKREKYDALVEYIRGLVRQLAATEDERDIAQYRARRANMSERVVQQMLQDSVVAASQSVSQWLESHSIRELSKRTGISYATCYRIVNERMGTLQMDVGNLSKFVDAVVRGSPEVQHNFDKVEAAKGSHEEGTRQDNAGPCDVEKDDKAYNDRLAALYREVVMKEKVPASESLDLMPQEKKVVEMLVKERKQIAAALNLSEERAKNYVARVLRKLAGIPFRDLRSEDKYSDIRHKW